MEAGKKKLYNNSATSISKHFTINLLTVLRILEIDRAFPIVRLKKPILALVGHRHSETIKRWALHFFPVCICFRRSTRRHTDLHVAFIVYYLCCLQRVYVCIYTRPVYLKLMYESSSNLESNQLQAVYVLERLPANPERKFREIWAKCMKNFNRANGCLSCLTSGRWILITSRENDAILYPYSNLNYFSTFIMQTLDPLRYQEGY